MLEWGRSGRHFVGLHNHLRGHVGVLCVRPRTLQAALRAQHAEPTRARSSNWGSIQSVTPGIVGTFAHRPQFPVRRASASLHPKRAMMKTPVSLWSQAVTRHSNALDLERGVFTFKDPRRIAASLKRSAEASTRRKADPFRSALSMLTFYINRAGKNLAPERRKTLMCAKRELRRQFGRQ